MRLTWLRLTGTVAALLLLGWLLASCGLGKSETPTSTPTSSEVGNISLGVSMSTGELYMQSDRMEGVLSLTVTNTGSEDIEVDVWVDVLPGIHFVEGFRQTISDDGQRAMRSGVIMRPSESRTLDFIFGLSEEVDPGVYMIEINVSSSAEDLVTSRVAVEVKRQ